MKRMCLLCVALFVLVMALPALATETRVMVMGNQWMTIQDDYNIWHFTSTVNNYPRHLIVDHGGNSSSTERLGMIIPFMKGGVLGAFFSDEYEFSAYSPIGFDQRLDLFYGYRATNFDLGLHVDWWGDKVEVTGTQSATVLGLQAGVGFNANGNQIELDAGYKSLSWTDEDLGTGTAISERDAGSMVHAAGRVLYAYNNMVTLVPAIAIQQVKESVVTGPETKATFIDLAVGCNTVPLQGTEFITTFGVMADKFQINDATGTAVVDESDNVIPYVKFGADIQVRSWLNFLVGAQKYLVNTFEDKIAPGFKSTSSDFQYMIGASIMVGDVQFDAEVEKEWLNDGPNFLSGEADGDMFARISFKYDYR